ncbi:MAG: hypothetical protein ACO3EP_12730, partial [Phycisphaerales bacterium]
MKAGRWEAAVAAWTSVLRIMPGDTEATAGLRRASAMLDRGDVATQYQQDLSIMRQRAQAEYEAAVGRANEALAKSDFRTAEVTVVKAKVDLQRAQQSMPVDEYSDLMAKLDGMLDTINRAQETAIRAAADQARLEADLSKSKTQQAQQEARQRLITENLIRVRQLQLEMKYSEALEVLDQILFLDPHNPAALTLR